MFTELLWIIGFYAAAAALAHAVYARRGSVGRSRYVLVAGNHEMQIEWYLWSLRRFARRTGKDIGIVVVLDRSADETGEIVERFARGYDHIGLVRSDSASVDLAPDDVFRQAGSWWNEDVAQEPVVWVDLNNREHLSRLPL